MCDRVRDRCVSCTGFPVKLHLLSFGQSPLIIRVQFVKNIFDKKKRIANIWSASSFLDLFFAQLHRSSIGKAIKLKIERVTKQSGSKFVQFITICSRFFLPILADSGFLKKLFVSRCREVYSFLGI